MKFFTTHFLSFAKPDVLYVGDTIADFKSHVFNIWKITTLLLNAACQKARMEKYFSVVLVTQELQSGKTKLSI